MGLFDFLSGRSKAGNLGKHAARAANKRAQNPDRYDSLAVLAGLGTQEAVEALLPRFTFRVDPSIVDQEEKDLAFEGCVAAGDAAIEPVKAFLARAQEVSWPLKILERLVPEEDLVTELLALLDGFDTEYERDPKRKIQVISYLEDRSDPRIANAIVTFLEDMNDEVRFHAVRTLFAQSELSDFRPALAERFLNEDSVRIRARIAEGFLENNWTVEESEREAFSAALPTPFVLDRKTGALTR